MGYGDSSVPLPGITTQHVDVQRFHPLPCPRGPAKELEAGSNTGVVGKAADINLWPQRIPAIERNQFVQ